MMAKALVLYYSATNTTKNVAEKIAQQLDADVAEIHAAQPYTTADLNWHDPKSRTSIEQHQHNSRVDIKDDLPDTSNYTNIIIGHPIWWGIPPRMISSVIDHLNLNGKKLFLFATSGGSSYGRSRSYVERVVKENGYDVQVKPGAVLNSDRQIRTWLQENNLN